MRSALRTPTTHVDVAKTQIALTDSAEFLEPPELDPNRYRAHPAEAMQQSTNIIATRLGSPDMHGSA